jgi:hypothetical protein
MKPAATAAPGRRMPVQPETTLKYRTRDSEPGFACSGAGLPVPVFPVTVAPPGLAPAGPARSQCHWALSLPVSVTVPLGGRVRRRRRRGPR